jgi:hypothetical protein
VDLPALLAVPAVAVTVTLLAAVAAALLVTAVVALVVRVVARRREWAARLVARARRPFRVLLVVVAVWIALRASLAPGPPAARRNHRRRGLAGLRARDLLRGPGAQPLPHGRG